MRISPKIKNVCIAAAALLTTGLLTSCANTDAAVVSENLSTAADNFEVNRRIVFYNGITDSYMLTIEGRCSINADEVDQQLEVTCAVGEGKYKKHFLGLSDNVTYFVEQTEAAKASAYRYRVIFKPATILPDAEIDLGGK